MENASKIGVVNICENSRRLEWSDSPSYDKRQHRAAVVRIGEPAARDDRSMQRQRPFSPSSFGEFLFRNVTTVSPRLAGIGSGCPSGTIHGTTLAASIQPLVNIVEGNGIRAVVVTAMGAGRPVGSPERMRRSVLRRHDELIVHHRRPMPSDRSHTSVVQ